MIIGGVLTLLGIIMLFFKKNALPQNPQQAQQQAQQQVNGIRRLIIEARAYRQWADQQPNPKMYRNWAHFINYLKGRGYGNNEKEICQRMTVTQKNISDVVKKYIL
jgi:predicted  nucleic acid-binding Zn-ribbon protein